MQLTVNGERREYAAANLAELWAAETDEPTPPRGCAMALNGAVVRKDAWAQTALAEGDRVEIVRAFAGG